MNLKKEALSTYHTKIMTSRKKRLKCFKYLGFFNINERRLVEESPIWLVQVQRLESSKLKFINYFIFVSSQFGLS